MGYNYLSMKTNGLSEERKKHLIEKAKKVRRSVNIINKEKALTVEEHLKTFPNDLENAKIKIISDFSNYINKFYEQSDKLSSLLLQLKAVNYSNDRSTNIENKNINLSRTLSCYYI